MSACEHEDTHVYVDMYVCVSRWACARVRQCLCLCVLVRVVGLSEGARLVVFPWGLQLEGKGPSSESWLFIWGRGGPRAWELPAPDGNFGPWINGRGGTRIIIASQAELSACARRCAEPCRARAWSSCPLRG